MSAARYRVMLGLRKHNMPCVAVVAPLDVYGADYFCESVRRKNNNQYSYKETTDIQVNNHFFHGSGMDAMDCSAFETNACIARSVDHDIHFQHPYLNIFGGL